MRENAHEDIHIITENASGVAKKIIMNVMLLSRCFNSLAFRESSPYLAKLSSPVTAALNFLVNLLTGKWSDDYRHSWREGVQVYFMVMLTLCSRTWSPAEKPLIIMGLIACTKALCIWAHRVHPKIVDFHLKTNDLEKWHLIVYFIVCKHARIVLCFTI